MADKIERLGDFMAAAKAEYTTAFNLRDQNQIGNYNKFLGATMTNLHYGIINEQEYIAKWLGANDDG